MLSYVLLPTVSGENHWTQIVQLSWFQLSSHPPVHTFARIHRTSQFQKRQSCGDDACWHDKRPSSRHAGSFLLLSAFKTFLHALRHQFPLSCGGLEKFVESTFPDNYFTLSYYQKDDRGPKQRWRALGHVSRPSKWSMWTVKWCQLPQLVYPLPSPLKVSQNICLPRIIHCEEAQNQCPWRTECWWQASVQHISWSIGVSICCLMLLASFNWTTRSTIAWFSCLRYMLM
jgi:hypothetical protein